MEYSVFLIISHLLHGVKLDKIAIEMANSKNETRILNIILFDNTSNRCILRINKNVLF